MEAILWWYCTDHAGHRRDMIFNLPRVSHNCFYTSKLASSVKEGGSEMLYGLLEGQGCI